MTRHTHRTRALVLTSALALTLPVAVAGVANASEGRRSHLTLARGQAYELPLDVRRAGEAVLSVVPTAPEADWGVAARSGVVAAYVDGRHVTDLVVLTTEPEIRRLALGELGTGRHVLRLVFDERSPAGVSSVQLDRLRVDVTRQNATDFAIRAHAPIVVGRAISPAGVEVPWQNALTDTPLLGWHETAPAETPGHTIVEYSVIWSNEDGGTNTPQLMARWGRTTDIEWIYRVELDEAGNRVPGSDVFQAPDHATLHFGGEYVDGHPVLQTCTYNNNMCDVQTTAVDAQMRFLLDYSPTRPAERAREQLMDSNPWTYEVMAKEVLREGQIEPVASPATLEVGDQRTYLYIETTHSTATPTGPGAGPAIALAVTLKGDPTVYRSDHSQVGWGVQRTIPATSTVELPAGTTAADIARIDAVRVPYGRDDNGAPETVTSIGRAFFLAEDYRPGVSFLSGPVDATVTSSSPVATLWAAGDPPAAS